MLGYMQHLAEPIPEIPPRPLIRRMLLCATQTVARLVTSSHLGSTDTLVVSCDVVKQYSDSDINTWLLVVACQSCAT